jgi:hypothetical protein
MPLPVAMCQAAKICQLILAAIRSTVFPRKEKYLLAAVIKICQLILAAIGSTEFPRKEKYVLGAVIKNC